MKDVFASRYRQVEREEVCYEKPAVTLEGLRQLEAAAENEVAALAGASRHCPRRTANRPGSQRMARYKITDFLQSASAGRHAADGDRPRSGGSIQMRPALAKMLVETSPRT